MLGVAPYILTAALLIAPVASTQAYVGCDLISTQTANLNVMTTQTQTVMGAVPQDSATIVTTDATTFTPGSTVTLTFGANFGRGVVQATDGTFAAQPQFDGQPTVACVGTATAMYKTVVGATNPVTWTAPATGTTVTLNVIGTTAYGQTYRRIVTLTDGSTATGGATTAGTVGTGATTGASTGATTGATAATTGATTGATVGGTTGVFSTGSSGTGNTAAGTTGGRSYGMASGAMAALCSLPLSALVMCTLAA